MARILQNRSRPKAFVPTDIVVYIRILLFRQRRHHRFLPSAIEQDPSIRPRTSQWVSQQILCVRTLQYYSIQIPSTPQACWRSSEHHTGSVCFHQRAHKVSSLFTEIVASCIQRSPLTDTGNGVGADTSSLSVVAQSFTTHRDLTSFPLIRRANR